MKIKVIKPEPVDSDVIIYMTGRQLVGLSTAIGTARKDMHDLPTTNEERQQAEIILAGFQGCVPEGLAS